MHKVVLGLSGGMDSATLLGIFLAEGYECHCCVFNYGSKHNQYENKAAQDLVAFYVDKGFPVKLYYFNLQETFKPFVSNLLLSGGDIPEGHYEDENMKKTVVPGRNLIFASIMAGLAESIKAQVVGLGVHSGDHAIYPDCRPEFIDSLRKTIHKSTDGEVLVFCPLQDDNKTSIIQKGNSLMPAVPYHLTRTCYKDQQDSCGKCGSCQERLEAFDNLGIKDPIQYEGE